MGPDLGFARLQVGGSPTPPCWASRRHAVPSSCLVSTSKATERGRFTLAYPASSSTLQNPPTTWGFMWWHLQTCSSMGGVGGRWSGAKLSLKAAGAHLWTDVDVWVGTPESQSLGEGDGVGRAEEAGEQLESWNPSLVTLPYVLVAGNGMLLGHVTLLGAFERVWGCEDHERNKESGLRMENGCPCPPS